jgi:hypothetical protein
MQVVPGISWHDSSFTVPAIYAYHHLGLGYAYMRKLQSRDTQVDFPRLRMTGAMMCVDALAAESTLGNSSALCICTNKSLQYFTCDVGARQSACTVKDSGLMPCLIDVNAQGVTCSVICQFYDP